MKLFSNPIATFLLITLSSLLLGFMPLNSPQRPADQSLDAVKTYYFQGLDEFESAISRLDAAAGVTDPAGDTEAMEFLQDRLQECRITYKRIESLLAYMDAQAATDLLNGAPLPSLEENTNALSVLEPEGLQILDELIFSENPLAELPTIREKTKNLKENFHVLKPVLKRYPLTHRNVFEAVRQDLLRIFTLGLTGFDTPASGNAIPEAIASMESLHRLVKAYEDPAPAAEYRTVDQKLEEAVRYLRSHPDFDSFDRMQFLREYINPLYKSVYELQLAMNIETVYEVHDQVIPINYNATNLFADDFLNKTFFSDLYRSPTHEQKIALGRLLFFDPVLSANLERSCASCHQPQKGFADGRKKSLAFDFEGEISRNAPTVLNCVYSTRFFYDMRLGDLKKQMEHVVFNEKEFNSDFNMIVDRLQQSSEYQELFTECYPELKNRSISKWSVEDAITAYVESLTGFNSPVDQYIRGEQRKLDEAAIRGFNLFMGKAACGTCHFAPTFYGLVPPYYEESESEVLGVPATTDTLNPVLDPDLGRIANGRVTEEVYFYQRSFKTTTVRNVALTAPYMHNGVYETLEEVIDFYNKGGGIGLGMDVPHQTLPPAPLGLTAQEQSDLVAFMEALTDTTGLTAAPQALPTFDRQPELNERRIGGTY